LEEIKNTINSRNNKITIDDCFNTIYNNNTFNEEKNNYCYSCKKQTICKHYLKLLKLPDILIIILKRDRNKMYHTEFVFNNQINIMHNDYENKYAVALYQIASDLISDIELKTENNMVKVDFDRTMEFYDEDYERLAVDLTYIIDGLVEHIENILKDVKMCYNYIENFKKEQKEMFTEYVFSVYNFND
jgi:ubiquitin C-terminal hydrolase